MAQLHKRMKRGSDKLVGRDFYTAHWPQRGAMPEAFRLTFWDPASHDAAYTATFDRAEAEKIVKHFAKALRQLAIAGVLALTLPVAGCGGLADRAAAFAAADPLDFGAVAVKVKPQKTGGHVRLTIRF